MKPEIRRTLRIHRDHVAVGLKGTHRVLKSVKVHIENGTFNGECLERVVEIAIAGLAAHESTLVAILDALLDDEGAS